MSEAKPWNPYDDPPEVQLALLRAAADRRAADLELALCRIGELQRCVDLLRIGEADLRERIRETTDKLNKMRYQHQKFMNQRLAKSKHTQRSGRPGVIPDQPLVPEGMTIEAGDPAWKKTKARIRHIAR